MKKKKKLPSSLQSMTSIEEVHAYYQKVISNMPNNVYWLDQHCITQGCNKNVLNFIGLQDFDEFIGLTYEKMGQIAGWTEGHALAYQKDDMEVMATGKPILNNEDPPIHDGHGNTTYYLSSRVPIFDDNNEQVVGIIGMSVDITQRKKMETELQAAKNAAEAANMAKTEFLENMRHDIRTPLTGIVGFADIIKMASDSPQIKEYADNLVASSHALLDLLDEVLEAIRVSSGEIPKLKKKFNLQKTLQHIIELNRAKAAEKQLSLTLQFDANIPTYVIGDKVRIHRIALELVANALNFTDKGVVNLSVILAKRNHRELIIKLVVSDSGIGIPKDKQHDIYVQFKRLTPSYQGIYKGAGLGLSVVKQFVDELSGEIYLESELNKGSCFTCVIPLQEPLLDDTLGIDDELENAIDVPYQQTYAQQIKPIPQEQKQYRVLVVEDNSIAQIVAKSILTQLNCATDIAENGRNAIELWQAHHYDLIFMDIGLPDLDGYEVTHMIRIQELARKTHSPIIALTAHAGDDNKKRCIDAGMNAVLTKPLSVKSCTDIVDAFIPGRQQQALKSDTASALSGLIHNDDTLFNLTGYPILDIQEGVKTTGSESTLAQMLAFMINDSLPNDVALLKDAYGAGHWDKTQQLVHKIKGGAVYVGTIKLKLACQYFEAYWKTGQRDCLDNLYQQVVSVIDESVQAIRQWLMERCC